MCLVIVGVLCLTALAVVFFCMLGAVLCLCISQSRDVSVYKSVDVMCLCISQSRDLAVYKSVDVMCLCISSLT